LHTEQCSKDSNEAITRYCWILGGGSQLTEGSQGCVEPTSPNLARI